MYAKICRTCGGDFLGDGRFVYCDPCRKDREYKPKPRHCQVCSADIPPRRAPAIYCPDCKPAVGEPSLKVCRECRGFLPDKKQGRCPDCLAKDPPVTKGETTCSVCGGLSDRGPLSRFCTDCQSAGKGRRARGYIANDNEKARMLTKYAVKIGFLRPPTDFACKDCGSPAECYDHRDYRKPLQVDPVCLNCNSSRGRGIPLNAPLKLTG